MRPVKLFQAPSLTLTRTPLGFDHDRSNHPKPRRVRPGRRFQTLGLKLLQR
jgi:hypothetical protein